MHHYQKNIGDYAKKAGRLSILQHGVYNLLMDACYDRERFPTRDEAIDWVWASTSDEVEAVDFVLRKFFDLQDDGIYVQKRILEELKVYWDFCKTQSEKGKKGGRPKKPGGLNKKPDGKPPVFSENPLESRMVPKKSLTTNHQPLTTNHQPMEKIKTLVDSGESPIEPDNPDSLFDEFWTQYPRREGRQAAQRAFEKLKPDRGLTDRLLGDIAKRLGTGTWSEKQFIPHASTYLNGRRWEDELIPRGPITRDDRNQAVAQTWLEQNP